MTSPQSFISNEQNPISTIDSNILNPNNLGKTSPSINSNRKITTTWIERLKSYFTTNDGRIMLSDLFFTLICVILQHVMGTCEHFISDGTQVIKWHVFTPPCLYDKIRFL